MSRNRTLWIVLVVAVLALTAGISAYAKPPVYIPIGPDCRFVLCAYPDCLPNEHTEIPEGQCCPVCVPN